MPSILRTSRAPSTRPLLTPLPFINASSTNSQTTHPEESPRSLSHLHLSSSPTAMTQMWHLWWPKSGSAPIANAATKMEDESAATTTTAAAKAVPTKSLAKSSSSTCHCCCLVTKLMRKLRRRGRTLRPASRQSSMQCRYDPLSYSLNFDSGGCGSLLDEDYYKFYAFSSRFAANANPRTSSSRAIVPVAAGGSP